MKSAILLTICLLLSGCISQEKPDILSQCTIEDSWQGYQGVWLVYRHGSSIHACDLKEYRNGISLKEILEK